MTPTISLKHIDAYQTTEESGITRVNIDVLSNNCVCDTFREEAFSKQRLEMVAAKAAAAFAKAYGIDAWELALETVDAAEFQRRASR